MAEMEYGRFPVKLFLARFLISTFEEYISNSN